MHYAKDKIYRWVAFLIITLIAVVIALTGPRADSGDVIGAEDVGFKELVGASTTTKDLRVSVPPVIDEPALLEVLGPLQSTLLMDDLRRCQGHSQASPFGMGGDEESASFCADVEDRRPLIELVLDDLAWQRMNSVQALDAEVAQVTALQWQADATLRQRLMHALEKCLAWAQLGTAQVEQTQDRPACARPSAEIETLFQSAMDATDRL